MQSFFACVANRTLIVGTIFYLYAAKQTYFTIDQEPNAQATREQNYVKIRALTQLESDLKQCEDSPAAPSLIRDFYGQAK